jgi:hypothetical protein
MRQPERPMVVRLCASCLLVLGSLSAIGWFSNAPDSGGASALGLAGVFVLVGLALMWGGRWAWALGVALGILLLVMGIWTFAWGWSAKGRDALVVGSTVIIFGGLLLLAMLASPTRRWLQAPE